jgi:hypothetical protein
LPRGLLRTITLSRAGVSEGVAAKLFTANPAFSMVAAVGAALSLVTRTTALRLVIVSWAAFGGLLFVHAVARSAAATSMAFTRATLMAGGHRHANIT